MTTIQYNLVALTGEEEYTNSDIISLPDLKIYLKLDSSYEVDDNLLLLLTRSAINLAEKAMNRHLLTRVYEQLRDSFDGDLTLRRGGFQSVEKIECLVDGVYQELDAENYKINSKKIFGEIYCLDNVPSFDNDPEAIKITFKVGYGDSPEDIPEEIKIAIMQHIAFLYSNRGDCTNVEMKIPAACQAIYSSYEIIDVSANVEYSMPYGYML